MQILDRSTGLSDSLANSLAAAIRAGEFAPGARLPTEKQLVERYAVSRAVVREAIARLKTDGFVETRQGAGAFVTARPGSANFRIVSPGSMETGLPDADLAHVFELRGVIEAGMAELAAQRRSEEDLILIRAALGRMDQALASAADGGSADDAFHAAIAKAAGNPYLAQFSAYLAQHFSATRAVAWMPAALDAGNTRASQREHRKLFAAIEARNPEAAARAAREHIRQSEARYTATRKAG